MGRTIPHTPPRGTRDFYPEQMEARNALFSVWREVAASHGFVEYDSSILEHEELYVVKSGQEILEQLYGFADKGGRRVALRPEMTPSLARMVAARGHALPKPLKWFSIAQCFRYERMAKGRRREHYQWNLDIVGVPEVTAEAEVLSAAVSALEKLGLEERDVVIRISHRGLLASLFRVLEIEEDLWPSVFGLIDKRGKESEEALWNQLRQLGIPEARLRELWRLLDEKDLEALGAFLEKRGGDTDSAGELDRLFALLEVYGIGKYCELSPSIVRGLPYYTGAVFECFDRARRFRAVFGGGRYDRLFELFGAGSLPAVGLGFGDVVIQEILEAEGIRPWVPARLDFYFIPYSEAERAAAIRAARILRKLGLAVDMVLSPRKLKLALRECGRLNPRRAVLFLPEELEQGMVVLKNMDAGREDRVSLEVFLKNPTGFLDPPMEETGKETRTNGDRSRV